MEIIPVILTSDAGEARRLLGEIGRDKRFKRVQIDFIDGEYANNKTIKPEEVDLTLYLHMDFDAHLMVVEKNVAEYKKQAEKVGFDRIIAQLESISNPENFAGLALDIHSPIEAIEPYLGKLEVIVLMSIEPGFGGQEFNGEVIRKIKQLSELRSQKKLKYKIQIDGGVQKEHLEMLEKGGVNEVVVGVKRVLEWM